MAQIGVGIIGFGLAGKVFHAPFVSAVSGLKLEAFVERKTDEAHRAYPGTRTYRTVEEMLADDNISLVVVATPNETHFDLAKQALQAGKHVVIDKPFADSSAHAKELIALAKKKTLVLAPFHNRRWDGDFQTVKKVLAEGQLGRLVTFESHFDRFKPIPRDHSWKESAHRANGMLMDLGPHLVDQALALFGMPKLVTASVRTDREGSSIEDAFDIILTYDGLLVYCRASMLAAEASPRFLLHGTAGSFRKFGLDPQEPAIVAGARVPRLGDAKEWLQEEEEKWGELVVAPVLTAPGTLVRTKVKTDCGDYRGFYANVRDAIDGSAKLEVPPEAGLAVAKVLEAARVSSAEGRSVEV
jgi:scyllo-inositol 2-dehydrogenase (NADP+)